MIESMKKSKAGFTLVELIVVIAILGILAGISVPVYTGYIKKAGEASDMQLLGAMNTAFAAACASRGLNPTDIEAGVTWTDNRVTGVTPISLNDDFVLFWGENAGKSFTTFTSIGYDKAQGVFVGDGGTIYMSYERADGKIITLALNAEDVNDYKESIFNKSEEITAAQLMEKVQDVANHAADVLSKQSINDLDEWMGGVEVYYIDKDGNKITQQEYNDKFIALSDKYYNEHKGEYDLTDTDQTFKLGRLAEAYANEQLSEYEYTRSVEGGAFTSYLHSLGMSDADIQSISDSSTAKANALVLMAAAGADGMDAATIISKYNSTFGTFALGGSTKDTVTAATIPYALAMAYAYSDDATLTHTINLGEWYDSWGDEEDYEDNLSWVYSQAEQQGYSKDDVVVTKKVNANGIEYYSYSLTSTPENAKSYFDSHSESMSSMADMYSFVGYITSSNEFKEYMQSEQAVTDTTGFLGAMSMINDNAKNVGWDELLNSGYNSDTLKGIVSTLVGEDYSTGN